MIENNGLRPLQESSSIVSNMRTQVSDLDIVGAYPNAGRALNISADSTHRELVKIEGMEKEDFMLQNINAIFGDTNSLEYCQQMFDLPSLYDMLEAI